MNLPLRTSQPIMCVGKKKTLGSDNKIYFFTVAIATDEGDAGSISCSEDVYDAIVPYHAYVFGAVYRDGQYKGLRIVEAIPEELYEEGKFTSAPAEPVKEDAADSAPTEPAAKKTSAKGK